MIGPLPYIGGKRRIARQLINLIPPHTTYVEPFAGGAQVFFHKPPSKVDVLNDIDGEVINFLRVCQRHPTELERLLTWQPASRALFKWHQHQSPETLTDIERAARFLYLQKNTWGGLRIKQSFHYAVTKRSNYSPHRLRIGEAAARLARVQIEQLPYESVIARYDRPTTFIFLDPPYSGVSLYRYNFTDAQFDELAAVLKRVKGKFLLSINDCELVRQCFREFEMREIAFTYTSARRPHRVGELLFSNYDTRVIESSRQVALGSSSEKPSTALGACA